MKQDYNWLASYSDIIRDKRVLELGSGPGLDTGTLNQYTQSVIATDLDPTVVVNGQTLIVDHSSGLPFEGGRFDVVVASLCLHYFTWAKTGEIMADIRRILETNGTLICRVNSDKDINYGAVGFPEIEPGLHLVKGKEKRFFKVAEIRDLLAGTYQLLSLTHKRIDRYHSPKYIYEFLAITA
ncbi:MAG: class I SAM-dependent methyltransferase [Chloroflexota bacterium]